ncbi:MAG: ABC transporter permease [Planctomycetota bacterium]
MIWKEFLSLLKDPKSRMAILAPPLVQVLVFSYAATYDLDQVPYAVFNEDRGRIARDLLARFRGSPTFRFTGIVTHDEAIDPLIDNERVLLVIHVPPDFSRDIDTGGSGRVQVLIDGRNSNTALIAANYVRAIVTDFNAGLGERLGRGGPPAELVTRSWYNPNLESRWFIVPGMVGLVTLVTTVLVTALSVSREREQGTFSHLQVTPVRPLEVILGKTVPAMLIGLVEATAVVLVAVVWFGVPLKGSLLPLYVGLMLFLFSSIGVGLMISSIATTMQQGLLGTFLFIVPAIILSGFSTPVENMPRVLQWITLANPFRHFLVILRGVFLRTGRLGEFTGQFWPMALVGLICMIAAGRLFRHRTSG